MKALSVIARNGTREGGGTELLFNPGPSCLRSHTRRARTDMGNAFCSRRRLSSQEALPNACGVVVRLPQRCADFVAFLRRFERAINRKK